MQKIAFLNIENLVYNRSCGLNLLASFVTIERFRFLITGNCAHGPSQLDLRQNKIRKAGLAN